MGIDLQAPVAQKSPSFQSSASSDDRPSLPSLGFDISRPSSASTVASSHHSQLRQFSLPGLSSLASLANIATSAPPAEPHNAHGYLNTNVSHNMTHAMSATPGGVQVPPSCTNCGTNTTPLWRRDEQGAVLCNACGLFQKLHNRPRPISLKTDVIKSRNRVKTSTQGQRKRPASDSHNHGSLPAAHPATASVDPSMKKISQPHTVISERSNSPISRTGTPGLNGHPPNIAPQYMFDSITVDGAFHSPSIPQFTYRAPSPAVSSVSGSHLEPPPTHETVTALKTRVSELEVINDLFRGRVAELEASQHDTERMRMDLDEAKRKIEELDAELAEYRGQEPRHKKMRMSDLVDEDGSSTPLTTPSQST